MLLKVGKITGIGIASILAVLIAAFVLAGPIFNTRLMQRYIKNQINTRLPGELAWSACKFLPFKGWLKLENFQLRGPQKELYAKFDFFEFKAALLPLLSKKILIESIHLSKPFVNISIDTAGNPDLLSAFPPPDTAAKSRPLADTAAPALPNLVIRSFKISGGDFYFKQPGLDVAGKSLGLSCSADLIDTVAQCELKLGPVELTSGRKVSVIESIMLYMKLLESGRSQSRLSIHTKKSKFEMDADAQDIFSKPEFSLRGNSFVDLAEIGVFTKMPTPLKGKSRLRFRLDGNLDDPNGFLSIDLHDFITRDINIPSAGLYLRLNNKVATVDSLSIRAWGGKIRVHGEVDASEAFPNGFGDSPPRFEKLRYSLSLLEEGVDLTQLPDSWFKGRGRPDIKLSLDGRGLDLDEMAMSANLGLAAQSFSMDDAIQPVDVAIHLKSRMEKGEITVTSLSLNSGEIKAGMHGGFSVGSQALNLQLNISAPNLSENLKPLGLTKVSGSASLQADVKGRLRQPIAQFAVKTDGLAYGGYRIGNLNVNAETNRDGRLIVNRLSLDNRNSHLKLSGEAELFQNGEIRPFKKISYRAELGQGRLRLEDFMDSAACGLRIAGQISGKGARPNGRLRLIADDIRYKNLSLAQLKSGIVFEDGKLILDTLAVGFDSGGSVYVQGEYAASGRYDMVLNTSGISLQEIPGLALPDSSSGQVSISLAGSGNIKNPSISGHVAASSVIILGKPMSDNRIKLDLKDSLLSLSGTLLGDISAVYELAGGRFDARLDLNDAALAPYLAILGQEAFSGRVTTSLNVKGRVSDPGDIVAEWSHKNLTLRHSGVELLKMKPFTARFEAGRYRLDDLNISVLDVGHINLKAGGDLKGKTDIGIEGGFPLAGFSPFLPDFKGLAGYLDLKAGVTGRVDDPIIFGRINLDSGRFLVPGLEQQIHNLSGSFSLVNDSIHIQKLRGDLDGGQFEMTGMASLDSLKLSDYALDVNLNALPVRLSEKMDLKLDGNLSAAGLPDSGLVRGDLVLLEGLYYQDIKTNLFQSLTKRERTEGPPKAQSGHPFLEGLRLNVGITTGQSFVVDNNLAMLSVKSDAGITGTAANPGLNGRAVVESGTIYFQKKNFEVKKGVIDFLNPYKIEPTLDIHGRVEVRDWEIGLFLKGTPDEMELKLISFPQMSQEDILSLLMVGRTTAELLGKAEAPTTSTEQLLRQAVANMGARMLQGSTGLDVLEIEAGSKNESGTSDIKVTMGKRLSRRLLTKYSMESSKGVLIRQASAEYQILENLILSGFQDTRGVYGGEMKLKLEFR